MSFNFGDKWTSNFCIINNLSNDFITDIIWLINYLIVCFYWRNLIILKGISPFNKQWFEMGNFVGANHSLSTFKCAYM